jgi:hypothetical protein
MMRSVSDRLPIEQLRQAAEELSGRYGGDRLSDNNVEVELRAWLDAHGEPLPWTHGDRITPDEWFFVTTLYGEMTLDGQRTHIRRHFSPLFAGAARRDIRNFVPGMPQYAGLRSRWMQARLCRMGELLRDRRLSMSDYTEQLRALDQSATPADPMPALDAIIRDHRATGSKTLSVFIRDCLGGNAFPIDTRVEKELARRGLPEEERTLVSASLAIGENPRRLARMFFEAGGAST